MNALAAGTISKPFNAKSIKRVDTNYDVYSYVFMDGFNHTHAKLLRMSDYMNIKGGKVNDQNIKNALSNFLKVASGESSTGRETTVTIIGGSSIVHFGGGGGAGGNIGAAVGFDMNALAAGTISKPFNAKSIKRADTNFHV